MSDVVCRHEDAVAVVTLNRPQKYNALTAEMLDALVTTLQQLEQDPQVRAIVLLGGPKAFSAGADTGTLASASAITLWRSGFSEKWDRIAAIEKPVIAAVSGYALGGGLELALLCDIIIADTTAQFGLPESHIGIIPGAGGTQRLVRAVGKSLAMEMLLCARRINGEEARQAGLISQLVQPDELETQALSVARQIAKAAPLAAAMIKKAVLASYEMPLSAGVAYERALSALIADSEDRAAGLAAFQNRQTPQFSGR
ncbi:enoyl-CoA hydratase [Kosakonia radicincitans DSM 16656]|uniref:Enoyl-CoA hydratase n=1 Tax=Kosakonia radicincitans TaxID=283686 RepID=A0AAX2ETV8_9ENTR|nr:MULTISPECIES: enoyl-CoA hydratase-related protein [Kosakonia]MDP9565575.1 enoyl-CoA hydratase [Kosakonia oryzae]ARD59026.1 enoyl-CoA hydratase [Kosakonia radicincitans DSM 16656]NCF05810.1 enoyl-CoA hydratase [Kosakonia sp. MH5]SET29374.1 enoyl-CoA hydratase [Kosakonia radicincitans]SFE30594.1 enoyl-CoA hydratase [Kosakonia radicincitans]